MDAFAGLNLTSSSVPYDEPIIARKNPEPDTEDTDMAVLANGYGN